MLIACRFVPILFCRYNLVRDVHLEVEEDF